jgi:hypothetical protein
VEPPAAEDVGETDKSEQDVPVRYVGGSLTTPPPTHDKIREYEKNLPQHNLDLPFPEGRTGRYVRFNLQPKGQGWNNILNEWCVKPLILLEYSELTPGTSTGSL